MNLSPPRRMVDKCTPRDKYARTHIHLKSSFLQSSDDSSLSTVSLLEVAHFHALSRFCSPVHLGLTRITHDSVRSLPQIHKAGSICQHPSDQPSVHAIMPHRPLRMTSLLLLLHTRTRSKSCSVRCITLTLTQLASIVLMINFSSHLLSRLWMYAILMLSTTKSLCLSSSPFNPVYVTARGCMTARLSVMRILSTIGMRTTP